MKSIACAAVAIMMLAAGRAAPSAVRAAPPSVGNVAPDFELKDQMGKTVRLTAARGQKVVLVFYRGHW